MMESSLSRRTFIQRVGAWTALAASSGLLVQACGGEREASEGGKAGGKRAGSKVCQDVAKLSDAEKAQRKALGYVEASTQEGRMCALCQQFIPPVGDDDDACGTCKVVPGSVNRKGVCNVWVKKDAT